MSALNNQAQTPESILTPSPSKSALQILQEGNWLNWGASKALLGDCMDAMRMMPDNWADLAIVDPPYGVGVNHSMGRRKGEGPSRHKKLEWDSSPPEREYFLELMRVSKNQIIWGANHFISRMPYDSSCWLMWDKKHSFDVSFAQFELAWTSFTGTCKKHDESPGEHGRIHPTQKPVALYKWLLQKYAKPGDKILDTHLGSGSSRIAAYDMGFDFTACELDEDYFEAQEKRFSEHIKKPGLFAPEQMYNFEQTQLFEP